MSRIGLIVPHTDTTLERDLQRTLRGAHGVHTERAWLDGITVDAEEAMLRDEVPRAAEYLRPIRPDVAIFGCTSAGAMRGPDGEIAFVDWLQATLGCPVLSAFSSVRRRLLADGASATVWLVTPYTRPVHETMLGSLEAAGLSLRDGGCMGIESDVTVGMLDPEEIERFVMAQDLTPGPGDRVFVSCTNLRVAECADSLARRLGCTVTSSNLAILEALEPMLEH